VRFRALVSLLVLTAADYALWDWSIAEGHDVLSLVAGLTLLPLAAVAFGGVALTGARLLRLLLGGSSSRVRAHTHGVDRAEQPQPDATAERSASSSRLAA
jgi:hypothetical protein